MALDLALPSQTPYSGLKLLSKFVNREVFQPHQARCAHTSPLSKYKHATRIWHAVIRSYAKSKRRPLTASTRDDCSSAFVSRPLCLNLNECTGPFCGVVRHAEISDQASSSHGHSAGLGGTCVTDSTTSRHTYTPFVLETSEANLSYTQPT